MEQRVSLITLAVADVEKARGFYRALGWDEVDSPDGIVVFDLLSQSLGLYPIAELAKDMGVDQDVLGHGAMTLSYNGRNRAEVDAVLDLLKKDRSYAKATHNTWAAMLPTGGLKADDGETGAGMVILRMMERDGLKDHVIIVTRWYGGKKLGGDRFRRVQDAVRAYVDEIKK